MIDEYLDSLRRRTDSPVLEGFESLIWTRVATDEQLSRNRNLILGWQASFVALVIVVGAITVDAVGTPARSELVRLDAFSVGGVPAPSTLLLGSDT